MNNILKYIEILSIEQVEDKYYLQVALHANSVTEVYWQIDEVTYENLYLQCDFTGSDRYRLSFKILENPFINKLVGRITRTYLTSSSMIDFQTTKEFKEQIQLIKLHSQTNTLYQLPFIEQNIHGLYVDEPEVEVNASTSIDDTDTTIVPVDEIPSMELELIEEEIVTDQTEVVPPDEIKVPAEPLEQSSSSITDADVSNATAEEASDLTLNDQLQEVRISDDIEDKEVQQSIAPTLTEVLEEQIDQPTTEDSSEAINENQATMLKTLVEERIQEHLEEVALQTQSEEQLETDSEPMHAKPFDIPIKTIMTLPTIKQHSTTVHSVDEEDGASKEDPSTIEANVVTSNDELSTAEAYEVASNDEVPTTELYEVNSNDETTTESNDVASNDELTTIESNGVNSNDETTINKNDVDSKEQTMAIEQQPAALTIASETTESAVENENTETVNIATEEVKVAEVQMLAADTTTTAEPTDLTDALKEQSEKQPEQMKQPIVENKVEEAHNLSNNMIALIAVVVAIFIAVAIYFAFFQQNANTLNTESAEASESTNAVTYNIEESFTFSLPSEYVALTFNRGPSPYTEEILSILKEYNYGATFFLQGNQVPLYPDLVKSIDANGHSIGHITNSHTLLTILEIEDQREALVKPKEQIEQLINKETLLVRPPFNTFNQNTISIQQEYNFKIVNSSIALKSGNDVQADSIIQEFLNTEKIEGAIIGLDESQATLEALPTILEKIKQSDLRVVLLK